MTNAEWVSNLSDEEAMTWGREVLIQVIGGYCPYGYLRTDGRLVFYDEWLNKEHEEIRNE